jgi:hypothetical protein
MSVLGCPLVVSSSFAGHWLFGDGGCIYSGFVITFCGLSTILILAIPFITVWLLVELIMITLLGAPIALKLHNILTLCTTYISKTF